jgi:hypothetical protein
MRSTLISLSPVDILHNSDVEILGERNTGARPFGQLDFVSNTKKRRKKGF